MSEPDDVPRLATDEAPSLPWRQLHPASVAVNLLPRTWQVVRSAWPLLLLVFFNSDLGRETSLVDLLIVMVFFLSVAGQTFVHYLTLRYRVNSGRLEIRSGLLNRQVRVIDPERIQNTELHRNVAHRLSGLVEVRIETASGTEVEGELSALTVEDAEELVQVLEWAKRRGRALTDEADEPEIIVGNDLWDLVRYGATITRVGAVALLMTGVLVDLGASIAPDAVAQLEGRMSGAIIAVALVGVLSGAWLFGIGSVFIQHFGFRLTLDGDRLVATEGLLSTRRVELKLHKVQLLLVSQPLLRRLAGFGSLQIETAAAREGPGGGIVSAATTVPVVDTECIDDVMRVALPSADISVADSDLRRPHPKALVREIAMAILRTLFATAVAYWLLDTWGLLVLLWLPVAVGSAWFDYLFQGWLVTPQVVVSRRGYWDRRTTVVAREKLQSVERFQGPIQRIWGLAFLRVRVAGNSVLLPEIAMEDADEVRELLSGRQLASKLG